MIFYDFENKSDEWKSHYNGIPFGKENKLNYNYSIGYISSIGDKKQRYNSDKKLIKKFVEWSEERQAFFDAIQNSFQKIIERIKFFEEGLTEETINQIISNKMQLLG